jgi:hypothetical protein
MKLVKVAAAAGIAVGFSAFAAPAANDVEIDTDTDIANVVEHSLRSIGG